MSKEPRWIQRFQNFDKAFQVFQRRIDEYRQDSDSEAFQMALIQSFEMLLELSWKTLKDYLEFEGIAVATPKQTLRQAFQSNLVEDGETWLESINYRNLTSHTYDDETAQKVLKFIDTRFHPLVCELHQRLQQVQ